MRLCLKLLAECRNPAGAFALEKSRGGRGVLLGGVAGVEAANVVIIGGGVVGACHRSNRPVGSTPMSRSLIVILMYYVTLMINLVGVVNTVYSTHDAIEKHVLDADLVIGGVLIAGAAAPKLVTKAMVKT